MLVLSHPYKIVFQSQAVNRLEPQFCVQCFQKQKIHIKALTKDVYNGFIELINNHKLYWR